MGRTFVHLADADRTDGQTGRYDYVEFTTETALKQGIHPRVEIGDPAEAARYQAMDVKHFCLGWDVGILHDWWRANGRQMREHLETQETTR